MSARVATFPLVPGLSLHYNVFSPAMQAELVRQTLALHAGVEAALQQLVQLGADPVCQPVQLAEFANNVPIF
jgi:hypothetical protein